MSLQYSAPLHQGATPEGAPLPPGALFAPAAARNAAPLREQLARLLAAAPGRPCAVLELAAGGGQHAADFAASLPAALLRSWQATDKEASGVASCAAYRAALPEGSAGRARLPPPRQLDVQALPWPPDLACGAADLVLAVNLLHISPPAVCGAVLRGAAAALRPGGLLALYGPFLVQGRFTTPSNEAFDAQLRAMSPEYGLRDMDMDVFAPGAALGLARAEVVAMPANNFLLVLRKSEANSQSE
jgi:hypothetical protein